jgi:hypothetical protein
VAKTEGGPYEQYLSSLVHSLKTLWINDVVRFDGPAGDGGPAQDAQEPVLLFVLGALDCCSELIKNEQSSVVLDGAQAIMTSEQ